MVMAILCCIVVKHSSQAPSQFGLASLMILLELCVFLLQKSSAVTYVNALEAMLSVLDRKCETVDPQLRSFVAFYKMVR